MDLVVSANRLVLGGESFTAALGKGGIRPQKREGDGATPVGCFALRRVLYRADRVSRPLTGLAVAMIGETDGWCDDPDAPEFYNRPITLPHSARHEKMWRDDELYDVVVILGHNDDPPIPGLGSAIFLHCAKPDYSPTEGCVALARDDLLLVLERCRPGDQLCVLPPP